MTKLRAGYWWKVSAGLFSGLFFGMTLALIASVIRLVAGGARFEERIGSFGELLGQYLTGGVLAGLIGGILHPLAKSALGACIVGIAAMAPIAWIFGIWVFGPLEEWTRGHITLSVVWTIGVGGYFGYKARKMVLGDRDLSDW